MKFSSVPEARNRSFLPNGNRTKTKVMKMRSYHIKIRIFRFPNSGTEAKNLQFPFGSCSKTRPDGENGNRTEQMRTKIRLAGIEYRTKKEAEQAVRIEVARHALGQEFVSEMISDLIANHHYFCSKHKVRPEIFCCRPDEGVDRRRGGYQFKGFFPGIGWRSVSWSKCFNVPTWEAGKREMLRDACSDAMDMYRLKNYRCAGCGIEKPPLNCHHKKPSFAEMMRSVDRLFTDQDGLAWENRDWMKEECFTLGEKHPAIVEFMRLHSEAVLVVLCENCHKKEHQKERQKT